MSLAKAIVGWLESMKENRGIMADLRKSLRSECHEKAWPYIANFCNLLKPQEELITRTLAGLYALHPCQAHVGNIGASIRMLAMKRGGDLDLHERYLKRFLNCRDPEDVCERLPFIVHMFKSTGVPLNYEQLYTDLYWWNRNRDDERVRREWCQGYYKREGNNVSDQNNPE